MATQEQTMKGLQFTRRFTKDGVDVFSQLQYDYRSSVIRNPSGEVVFEMNNVEIPSQWSQIATDSKCPKNRLRHLKGANVAGQAIDIGGVALALR